MSASVKVRGDMARRTRVKICGITRLQDARLAQELGADSLGFVFVPASARYITPNAAAPIISELSPFVSCVGLFLNASRETVAESLALIPGMVPQFHGQEDAAFCDQFKRPYLKAIGVGGGMPSAKELALYRHAGGFLFDSNTPGQLGGTGHVFDWTQLQNTSDVPLVLAGGLNAHNVDEAIEQVRPHAVDVSSGVEQSKGIKDAEAMRGFMAAVSRVDARLLKPVKV